MVDRSIIGADPAFCVEDLAKADFVAIRFDTSEYLFNEVQPMSMEEYFKAFVQRMDHPPNDELPQRLGLCCGVWHPLHQVFHLSSYDVGLFPGHHDPAYRGAQRGPAKGYIRKQVSQGGPRYQEYMSSPAVMVLKALREAKCPLLVYEGLGDLLQLFDKFLGPVTTREECFDTWLQHFPAIYDVKWMALQDPPGHVFLPPLLETWRKEEPQKMNLLGLWHSLYRSVWTTQGRLKLRFRELGMFDYRAQSVLKLQKSCGFQGEGYMGRMAMMIAESFVILNDYRMPTMKKEDLRHQQVSKKRRRELTQKFAEAEALLSNSDEVSKKRKRESVKLVKLEESSTVETKVPDSSDEVKSLSASVSSPRQASGTKRKMSDEIQTPDLEGTGDEKAKAAAEKAKAAKVPAKRVKRPRPRCMAAVRHIESMVDALARKMVNQRTEEDIDISDSYGMELLERCASSCRFFHNKLSVGPHGGCLVLDEQLVQGATREYEEMEDL